MFSDQFVQHNTQLHYRHRLQVKQEEDVAVFSSNVEQQVSKRYSPLPAMANTIPRQYSGQHVSKDKCRDSVSTSPHVPQAPDYQGSKSIPRQQPLLQKRYNPRPTSVNVFKSDRRVHFKSPVYSQLNQSTLNGEMNGLRISDYSVIKPAKSTDTVFSANKMKKCMRSSSVTHTSDKKLCTPYVYSGDLHVKRLTSSADHSYADQRQFPQRIRNSAKVKITIPGRFDREIYHMKSDCELPLDEDDVEEDIEGASFMDTASEDSHSTDYGYQDTDSLLSLSHLRTQELSSIEDLDNDSEYMDEQLLLFEVKRRRERDFGQDAGNSLCASCSWTEREQDYECDSLCTESELSAEVLLSDKASYTLEAEVKQEEVINTHAYAEGKEQEKLVDSSTTTDGICDCCVPVASSLLNLPGIYQNGIGPSQALTPSLFPEYFSSTIHFPLHNEDYLPFPKETQALLKWKVCSITPNIIKHCSARVGFSKCTRGDAWMGYWGKHMKAECFKSIKEYQKVNHFPGTFQIGRKDRLWRNLSRLQSRVGKKYCDFVPQTYVLPQDLPLFRKDWEEGGKHKWILKPPASARGIGIKVVNKWKDIPKRKPTVVQRYISDPYLINGMKFDLRIYVCISAYDPLKIFIFREGLARFATCKYSSSSKYISNRFMHLTNYSINKRNADFTPNTDETVCQGHKWGLLALWKYMSLELGVNTKTVWEAIKDVVIKTIICSESYVSSNVKAYVRHSSSVYELFGFDIMLDHNLKPWILEVNISPSLHSNSQLDVNIKGRLVRDLFNICGFKLYSKEVLTGHDTIPRAPPLSTDERIKHSQFIHKSLRKDDKKNILDNLTSEDIRILMNAEDELSRCGYFERVFPSQNSHKYRRFFETERYSNVLLGEWAERYEKCSNKGVKLLTKLASDMKKRTASS